MANKLLIDPHAEYNYTFDLESLFYVIIYMGIVQLGPNGEEKTSGKIPKFLWNWLHPETVGLQDLGALKRGLINFSDKEFETVVTSNFSPYMGDLIPCVKELKETLCTENVTYDG